MHRKLLKLSTVFFSMIKCVLRAHRQEIWIGRGFGFFHAYSREMNSVKIETLSEIGFRSRLSRLFLLHKSPICWLGSVLFVDEGWVQFGGSSDVVWTDPSYLTDDWRLITDTRPRRLSSADTRTLLVSRTRTNFGDRTYSAAGRPRVWNYLPTDLRQHDLS